MEEKITTRSPTFKGYASSYNVEILNYFNSLTTTQDTESSIKKKLKKLLTELRRFKFKKIESDDKTRYYIFYSHSKVETIINESGIGDVFESIYITVMSNIQKYSGKGSSWIIDWT